MSIRGRTDLDSLAFFNVFRGSKNRCKNSIQKVTKMVSKRDPKSEPKSPKWAPKAIPKQGSKKHSKMMIFSTLECGSCIVNSSNIDDFHVLVLTPFWVSFWRCFGSSNGGQSLQKATSKKHQKYDAQNDPKLVPTGVAEWSQNRQK